MRPDILTRLDTPAGFGRDATPARATVLRLGPAWQRQVLRVVVSAERHRALPAPRRISLNPERPRLLGQTARVGFANLGRDEATGVHDDVSVSFRAGEEIYRQGMPADHWYEVVSGAVRASRLLPDGRRQVVGFHLAGNLFGFDDAEGRHSLTVEAASESETVVLRHCRRRLDILAAQDASFACWLGELTRQGLRHAHAHLLLLGRKSSTERLASFLLEMRERLPPSQKEGPSTFSLPMGRTDIADYLGVTLETVCRTFQALRRRGVIELRGHRRVRIVDLRELQGLSGELVSESPMPLPLPMRVQVEPVPTRPSARPSSPRRLGTPAMAGVAPLRA